MNDVPRLAPHGGCNWKDCRECFPTTTDPDELYDEWIPGERLAAYDTPRARAQREQKEFERLTQQVLRTINWETYNKEPLQKALREIYDLGYRAGERKRR